MPDASLRKTRDTEGRCWSPQGTGVRSVIPCAVLLVVLGCGRGSSSLPANASDGATPSAAAETSAAQPADQGVKLQETWDAVYMKDTKVGSAHTVFESIEKDGESLIRASNHLKLEIRRDNQIAKMQTRIVAIETRQGAVRSFRVETSLGPTPIITEGTYRDGNLHLVTTSQGKQMRSKLPWNDARRGFFALEQSLSDQPMQPGEKRELTMLMPGLVGIQVPTVKLESESLEATDLLDGPQRLLKIIVTSQIGDQQIDAICWTSPSGAILKMSHPMLQQTIYRTTRDRALAAGSGSYDLFQESIVKVSTPLPHHQQLIRADYRISLPKKDPSEVFVSGESQEVKSIDQRRAQVTVHALRPGSPGTGVPSALPSADDSASNSLIQCDDPQIVKMAQQMAGTASDTWTKCLALEKGVHEAIQSKNFGQGFATAADVARNLEGDCTEHSVLLAALCRAQKIPARVVLGLIYSRRDQGFAFHMWNEVWVAKCWIPIDATLGLGGIGAAHLKLRHSDLSGEAAETAVLSVLQVINQLEIEVIDFQLR